MLESILESFQSRNVLVTGGTGLIGRQIVRMLCEAGSRVKSVPLDRLTVHPAAVHIYGDLSEFGFCKTITQDMDYVFHVAGVKGSIEVTKSKPASFFVPLLMMNTNMLEACRFNKVQKVVYTSSIGAYPNAETFKEILDDDYSQPPMDFAGWAKRMAELQIRAYKVQYGMENFAIIRPSNVYGPGDNFDPNNAMVVPSLMYRIYHKEDPLVVWGDGSAIRDIVYSRDVAAGVILALYHGTRGYYVTLGCGKGYSIKELVEALHSFIAFDYEFDVTKLTGFPKRVMDISLAREWLGYEPQISLVEGLKKTWEWYISHTDEYLNKQNYFREL
ncbi:MAG: NAD(P)-dependent oxidoreductase [Anaerolineales bacterium]|nr:NAD(P)-dependent oxidoreductase [Anaerolineales bacterium]